MPAGRYPLAANRHGDQIVELESDNGCPSTRGATHDSRRVVTPGKVIVPPLLTGIEQRNSLSALRFERRGLNALEVIAHAASEPKVDLILRAACRHGKNMFDLELS